MHERRPGLEGREYSDRSRDRWQGVEPGPDSPVSDSIGLNQLLDMVQESGYLLEVQPDARLDGEHTGDCVIALSTRDTHAYFMVQAYALPLLQGYMDPTLRRDTPDATPALQPAP